jgi:hypothetical protein
MCGLLLFGKLSAPHSFKEKISNFRFSGGLYEDGIRLFFVSSF